MEKLSKKIIEIIGVPSDLGANVRGACMGPAALRTAELSARLQQLGYQIMDQGDIVVPIRDGLTQSDRNNHFLDQIQQICLDLATRIEKALDEQRFPMVLGGDHSIAMGSIAGVSNHFHKQQKKLGLIWCDAHADMNTPTSSPSMNIHGMPLAVALGQGHPQLVGIGGARPKVSAENTVLIGIRTIDKVEKEILRKSGVTYFTMRDIDEMGMYKVMTEALAIAGDRTAGIHLSFDLDGIDPQFAPGVSTPVPGGLNFREAHLVPELLFESGKLVSMDFVELNPFTDVSAKAANFAVDLIESALGKTIV